MSNATISRRPRRIGAVCVAGAVMAAVAMTGLGSASAASGDSEKPTATEVGVTPTEIRIAIIADVDNPIVPGVFQGAVDGVHGAAKYLNSKAGGGRLAGASSSSTSSTRS